MEKCNLKYGDEYKNILFKPSHNVDILDKNLLSQKKEEEVIKRALLNPIASRKINEIVIPEDKLCIVISDVTRLWQKPRVFLPILIEEIKKSGIKDENIIFLCALGSHRKQSKEEHIKILGENLYKRFKIIDHYSKTKDEMVYIGETSFKTPVVVNKLVKCTKVIITGGITFHDMAGFGGGRKSILPGVSSYETIMANHALVLNPDKNGINPNCSCGNLENNPMHLDMMEACDMIKPSFLLNVIMDSKGNITEAVAGDYAKAFERGCELLQENNGLKIKELKDAVIVSAGGFPKDINLYQSSKALSNAKEAVKKGGKIILFTQCIEGIGNKEVEEIINNFNNNEEREQELRRKFTVSKFAAYLICSIAKEYELILISDIKEELVSKAGIRVFRDESMIDEILEENEEIYVMPDGSSLLPLYSNRQK
ncbi:transcriptional regulator [Clostridium sporogenes]